MLVGENFLSLVRSTLIKLLYDRIIIRYNHQAISDRKGTSYNSSIKYHLRGNR